MARTRHLSRHPLSRHLQTFPERKNPEDGIVQKSFFILPEFEVLIDMGRTKSDDDPI
jgi:hypothetical protein